MTAVIYREVPFDDDGLTGWARAERSAFGMVGS